MCGIAGHLTVCQNFHALASEKLPLMTSKRRPRRVRSTYSPRDLPLGLVRAPPHRLS